MSKVISYIDAQNKMKEKIADYYKNSRFKKYCKGENGYVSDEDLDLTKMIHSEGDADIDGYRSLIINKKKIVDSEKNSKHLFDSANTQMVIERRKLNNIIQIINKKYSLLDNNEKNNFKLNDEEIRLLDDINIYFLCDDDLKKYLKLKLKDDSFISQKVIILNENLHLTIVNNVYTYYLCKENTFMWVDGVLKREPYDLPIAYIYQKTLHKGVTDDYQYSKLVIRFKPPFRSSILAFRSGINVSTGSPSQKMADFLTKLFVRELRLTCGFHDLDIGVTACQNKVSAAKIRFGICLNLLAANNGKGVVEYNPSKFAGAIVKFPQQDEKITLLVFETRKIICVGSKNEENLINAYKTLYPMLLNCMRTPENIIAENELLKNKSLLNNKNFLKDSSIETEKISSTRGRGRGRGSRGRGRGSSLRPNFKTQPKPIQKPFTNRKLRGRPKKLFIQ